MPKSWRYSANGSRRAALPMASRKKRRHGTRRWIGGEIERRIASCSCGSAGLAVKTFILLRSECSDWVPSLTQIRCEDLFRPGDPGWNAAFLVSILRDAAALVPEIGECADAVLHEDASLISAEMGIRWCHDRLGMESGGPGLQKIQSAFAAREIQAKLEALLDRIERTEARTPRGEAIKARRGGRVS